MTCPVKIGIIGGTGLDNPEILTDQKEVTVDTPFGKPSDSLLTGNISGVPCVLLARHGRKHHLHPTNVNYRANIWALKEIGCTHILATTCCGSLQEDKKPGEIIVLDQFIDRTTKRHQTFYDGEKSSPNGVLHLPMAFPFCDETRKIYLECFAESNIPYHKKGTMVTIEGPRFSSRAESILFHNWGADCVNMTTVPEVVLAKEAGICYAALALVTDYDSWREDDSSHVCVEEIMKVLKENVNKSISIIRKAIPKIAARDWTKIIKAQKEMVQSCVL